jgi:energy-coupling factor transporter ATP-binding protein EcfA2
MRITALKIANLRAIETAEFRFQPGFNLIVGVNGVGKTTVLETISRSLAQAIARTAKFAVTPPTLNAKDIRHGAVAATTLLELELADQTVQVQEQLFSSGSLPTRPGYLKSEVDVDAHGLQRRGRLKRAQRQAQETVLPYSGPRLLPDEKAFRAAAAKESTLLLAVYFGTTRASTSRGGVRKQRAVRPPASAYVDAFTGRGLELADFADWIEVLHSTAEERRDALPILTALDAAVRRFLPGYLRIRVASHAQKNLVLDQSDRETLTADRLSLTERQQLLGVVRSVAEHMSTNWPPENLRGAPPRKLAKRATAERARVAQVQLLRHMVGFDNLQGPLETLPDRFTDKDLSGASGTAFSIDRLARSVDVVQLSDGERGVLALVLDLTRRLAQANVGLTDPGANAAAVVLIDELELHLHPGWQRSIVDHLTQTFPKCQFIATTHSPQVIGEVSAGHVVLMHQHGSVEFPSQTFGMDSNWILRHIMQADDRNPEVGDAIQAILSALREGRTKAARAGVAALRKKTGETPDLAEAAARIARAEMLLEPPKRQAADKRAARKTKR